MASPNRNSQAAAEQRGFDVGGHVIITLDGVLRIRGIFRHNFIHVPFQIPPDIGADVLIDRQRSRCVLDKEMKRPGFDQVEFRQVLEHFVCDDMETTPARFKYD